MLLLLIPLAQAQPPAIHGPKVYGARPGHPILFRIPATGAAPITFRSPHLPPTLRLDPATGILTGSLAERGEYLLQVEASNAEGRATRPLKFVIGDTIALTPPMGWSTWYMSYENISDPLVRREVKAMIDTGLAAHGYAYINLDDGWNIKSKSSDPGRNGRPRDARGNLRTNRDFPDMKGLVEFIHSNGLKAGIYISPGPRTCAGYEGSIGHEGQDLDQFVAWGFDFLKYDWCSYSEVSSDRTLATYQKPYRLMGALLAKAPRDLVFNLCQYGMGEVWKWGREVGGNYWRTTGDISGGDTKAQSFWSSVDRTGFGQTGKELYAGPGGWNDPDNILIGTVLVGQKLGPTPLTFEEQKTYFSLWCMLSAPLVLGSDLTALDQQTLAVLTNDEAIDVNQDPLGRQAVLASRDGSQEIWSKPLEDGSRAVALFNRDAAPARIRYEFQGIRRLRDLWLHNDLGSFENHYETEVPAHGVVLLRER